MKNQTFLTLQSILVAFGLLSITSIVTAQDGPISLGGLSSSTSSTTSSPDSDSSSPDDSYTSGSDNASVPDDGHSSTDDGYAGESPDDHTTQDWVMLSEIPDGFSAPPADSQVTQALVTFYNTSTHEIWTAPTGGFVPASGWTEGNPSGNEDLDPENVGYAPSSLSGYIVSYHEPDETITSTYSVEHKVYGDDGFTYFSYEKISENVGRVTYTFENESNPQPEVKTLTFLSENSGTFTMVEYTDSTMSTEDGSVSGEFDISISDSQYGSSEGGYAGAPDDDHGSEDAGYTGEPHDDHSSPDAGQESGSEMVLYNSTTHEMVTPAEIAAGGTSWMLLDEADYPDYQHPAYYNYVDHFAIDSSGVSKNGWMLTAYSGGGGHDHGASDDHYGSSGDGYAGEPHDDAHEEDHDEHGEEEDHYEHAHDEDVANVLYNKSTHKMFTHQQIQDRNDTGWMIMDPEAENRGGPYEHPAYYHLASHQVLDHSEGSRVELGVWILTHSKEEGDHAHEEDHDEHGEEGDHDDHAHEEDHDELGEEDDHEDHAHGEDHDDHADEGESMEMVLHNLDTHTNVTKEDVEAGGTDWILLNEEEHPELKHPAYKNTKDDFIVDSSGASNRWVLMNHSDAHHEDDVVHIDKILFNEDTNEEIDPEKLDNESAWVLLDTADYPNIEHPAFLEKSTQNILDSSAGSKVGSWILKDHDDHAHEEDHADHDHEEGEGEEVADADHAHEEDGDHAEEKFLYNTASHTSITVEEITGGGTDWMVLDPESFPDYAHPAYYNLKVHAVVDQSEDSKIDLGTWVLTTPGKGDDHEHDHHEEHVDLELPEEYKFEDGSEIGYWEEERYSETGELEIVAHLDNGIQVIFDENGTKIDEIDPYSFFQQEEFDAGLSFNPVASRWMDDSNNSGKFSFDKKTKGNSPVSVDIRRVDGNESEYGSILYRISLLNEVVSKDAEPTLPQHDLNGTDLALGTSLSLTFNYDSHEPMYLIVSGAEVSGYRNTYPSWDGTPGSFTIKAKTVAPVASASNPDGSISSTFGITVQMGGERHYGGAIFETNVIAPDVGPAIFSSPWDPVFSFAIKSKENTPTSVRALMPKRHFNDHFGIFEISEVKAALLDENGTLSFVKGSLAYAPEEGSVGTSFKRVPHMGNEPAYEDPYNPYGSMPMQDTEMYLLDNDEFGLDDGVDAFLGDFDQGISYDPGDIVMYQGKTYVALEGLPAGTSMDSSEMWKLVEEEELYSDDFSLDEFKNPAEGSEEPHDHHHGNVGGEKVLYNTSTHLMVTPAEIAAGGTSWMLLDEVQHPDYKHPAYYNDVEHFAVDSSGAPSNGWMLTAYSGGGGHDHGYAGQPDDGLASVDDGYASQPDDSQYSSDAGSNQVSEQVANDSATPVTEQVDTVADSIRRSGEEALEPSEGNSEKKTVASKFDFDGDQLADSLLEISFTADTFPGEVQIGEPYVDPFASIDASSLGTISGTVKGGGSALDDFGIFIFSAPDGIDNGHWEPAPVFEFNYDGNGSYEAKVLAGTYYVEAWGFDPTSGKSYQADVYGNESDDDLPTLLTLVDESSIFTGIDFDLEEEFMIGAFAEVSASLDIPEGGPGEIYGAFLDLSPINEKNATLTDYPVYSLHVDFDGSIRGEAPVGDFLVELVSHGTPMDFESEVIWSIPAEGKSFDPLPVKVKQAHRVSGRVTDQDGDGVWADILFVNPNDEEDITYPRWEDMDFDPSGGEFLEGSFSVRIPEGTYKILALDHSGLFEDTYYNGSSFDDAEEVQISAELTGLDLTMVAAPFSTITVRLEDNASNPISGAWFNLFDGDDEFGPMFFPEVEETEDGNYTLNIPEGTYKVEVSAPNYKSFFMVRDDYGDLAWQESYWEMASSIETKDGETTPLGTAVLEIDEFNHWERFEMEWFDASDTDFVGNTIKGTVKTSQGAAVPNARIIARTADHLIWIDHFETERNGSFVVDNLPDGDWVVFAEPPFESDEFQGFRESDPNRQPVLLDGGQTVENVDLVLQASNISGRLVFPKKNKTTGVTKIQSLADAHIWVYQDSDGDGEPDFNDYESESTFNEAFGHTDDKGFFSLSLAEGGTYSIRIDLPGRMASLAPKPITFQLKNPDQELKIGNAIKLEWSTNKKVEKFDIRRKVKSSDDSYKTVFASDSDRLSSATTSYVDNTITPGVSYEYRVVSIDSKDVEENLSGDDVKASSPILYLSPPSKSISGFVGDDKNQSVSGAMIEAWRTEGEGWASTFSETNGSYELTLGPGEWEISVFRPYDQKVSWVYDAPPARVEFKTDASVENKVLEPFLVSSMAGGKIIGSVELPTGKTAAELSQYVYIDVYDPMGRGDWSNPDSDGNFEIPLQPGEYELSIWVDPLLTGYGSPTGQIVRVGKTSINIGSLTLATFDSNITGTLTTDSGTSLPNVEVWAWSEEGGWSSAFTNAKGVYTLNVAPGRWEVGYEIPVADDGTEPPYLPEPPKRVRIKQSGESKPLNFKARDASASVSGVVLVDENGSKVPVTDLDAWVYAKEYLENPSDDEFMDIIAEVPLSQFGTFSFPGFPGSYNVGIWLPPGSEYELPEEKMFQINESGQLVDDNGTVLEKAAFVLNSVSSSLSGEFKDGTDSLSGLVGEVYAMRTDGDGWRYASIESNGSYSMTLPKGNWVIDYYIEYDEQARNYPSYPQQPSRLEIIDGANALDFDFSSVDKISSTISGTVVDENGNDLNGSSVYVWAYREGSDTLAEYWNEVETDDDGNFSISILPGGRYEVGVFLTEELRQLDYLDSPVQEFRLKSDSNQSSVSFQLVKPSAENFISGTVTDDKNNTLTEALVYAWTYDGLEAETLTDENGSFSINVTTGSIWKVGAEYSEFNASDVEIFYFSKRDLDVDLRDSVSAENIDIVLELPDFVVPEGTSVTFDPSADFVTRLPDGTELTIPGGASNVSEDTESVRLVITPNAKLSKDASVKTADYGYSIELFDASGKKVEGNFKKDVIISIPVDITAVEDNGLDLDNIEGKYYSSTKNAWESAKTSTWDETSSKLTMTTDHFSEYVVGSTANVSDLSKESLSLTVDKWYQSSWFGSFYDAGDSWIFHEKLGWLYTQGDLAGSFWFYHPTHGWLWTGSSLYDQSATEKSFFYLYHQTESERTWLYYQDEVTDPYFYSYKTGAQLE